MLYTKYLPRKRAFNWGFNSAAKYNKAASNPAIAQRVPSVADTVKSVHGISYRIKQARRGLILKAGPVCVMLIANVIKELCLLSNCEISPTAWF